MTEITEDQAVDTLEIYNDEQKWWVNVRDNCIATIKQFEDSIKLQNHIQEMAQNMIEELKS
jgi:hypothetical protein